MRVMKRVVPSPDAYIRGMPGIRSFAVVVNPHTAFCPGKQLEKTEFFPQGITGCWCHIMPDNFNSSKSEVQNLNIGRLHNVQLAFNPWFGH